MTKDLNIFVFCAITVGLNAVFGQVLVTISDGTIQGQELQTFTNKTYYSFQKIPFATPPLGKLRFQSPAPPEKWEGVLDTSGFLDVKCHQISSDDADESEDCLYINVYTPNLNNASLATLLWIFGGAFLNGNPYFDSTGPQFLIDEDIIVVTFNYRLGAFGFLSTGDEIIPGNAGLKDQRLAIQWAHDNIKSFGGDPAKITLMGESSAGAATTYQILHTESEGLFRGAIIESGACLSPWSLQRYPKMYAVMTAKQLDDTFDNSTDSETLLEFLQSVSAEELDAAAVVVDDWTTAEDRQAFLARTYAPVIEPEHEGAFLTEKMYGKVKSGDFVQVPLLAGFNSLEGVGEANHMARLRRKMEAYDQNLDWLVPEDMRIEDLANKTAVGERIRDLYTGGVDLVDHLLGGVQYIGDNRYTRPVRKFAELYSEFAKVYFYQFSYEGAIGDNSATIDGVGGVAHAENYNYVWHVKEGSFDNADFDSFPEADVVTLKRMVRLWANFVKTLNPTPDATDDLLQNVIWPTLTSGGAGDFLCLDFDENLGIMADPKGEIYRAWQEIYESLGYDDFDTY